MDFSSTSHVSPLFQIPLELRENILSHLLLPQHVHTSSATPGTYLLNRSNRTAPTYVDSRIYLPSRLPPDVLCVCKQLREEALAYHARRLNSGRHATVIDPRPVEETTSHKLAERNDTSNDVLLERLHDVDAVRVTLEILRQFRGTMGYYTPERRELSPRFLGLTPLLARLKKIKFTVWAGYEWWVGTSHRHMTMTKRLQDDRRTVWEVDDANSSSSKPRPNPLTVAIDALLQHLPLVEEIKIDLLLHDINYFNWDLPETCWEGIRGWLDGPISSIAEERIMKVDRRFILVYHGNDARPSGTLLHQRESVQQDFTVRVERGTRNVSRSYSYRLPMLNVHSAKTIGMIPSRKYPLQRPLSEL